MTEVLNTVQEDICCAAALSRALLSGVLDGKNTWKHSLCGLEWTPVWIEDGRVRHWMPNCPIEVWK